MIKITRFFYIHVLVLPMMILAFFVGSPTTFFITYGVVLIHELCHVLAAVFLGVPVSFLAMMPFGMTVRLSPKLIEEPKKEVAIALSGPLANALMLLLGLWGDGGLNHMIFLVANAAVLALNLLPIPPLDGGRVLRAAVLHRFGLLPAARIMRYLSCFLVALLSVAGIVLLICSRGNMSLIMVAAFLIYSTVEEKRNSDILAMRMLIYEKEFLRQGGQIPTRHITLPENAPVRPLLRRLNFSTFYLITVLDDHLSVRGVATESDIIRTVTARGYGVTVGQCL